MDITYLIAAFIALIVGFLAGLVFVIRKGESKRRLVSIAAAIAVIVDFGLLIDWSRVGQAPAVLPIDLVFFTVYSFVGCTIGASLPLLGRLTWRKWRVRRRF